MWEVGSVILAFYTEFDMPMRSAQENALFCAFLNGSWYNYMLRRDAWPSYFEFDNEAAVAVFCLLSFLRQRTIFESN